MREYGSVSPQFWIGHTGKLLRGSPDAQVLALYLMTSPHANMIGVYHCPVVYMANDTGMTFEGATKALQRIIEVGIAEYDEASETVFVLRMAAFQVGEDLKATDNRVLGIKRAYKNIAVTRIKSRFHEIYGVAYHLDSEEKQEPLKSPSEAPPKQLTGTGTGTGSITGTQAPSNPPPVDNFDVPVNLRPVCVVLEKAGIQHLNILDPEFTRLASEPMATLDVWEWAAKVAIDKKNPKFNFVLGIVRNKIMQPPAPTQSVTVPGKPGPDPELTRIIADAAKAVPVPFHERAKINKILAASKST
jgi:hypothetical protein